ncbi:MAG: alpha-amylase family glycosyl hydrolase [Bacteroidota bacterium]
MEFLPEKLALVREDPWLEPYNSFIEDRYFRFIHKFYEIKEQWASVENFASAYTWMGLHYDEAAQGWRYQEWAPGAHGMSLIGDFNGWDRARHPMIQKEGGMWEVFLPDAEVAGKLVHGSLYKVHVESAEGGMDRVPAYATRVIQNKETLDFAAQVWHPTEKFVWSDSDFKASSVGNLIIYEAHTGMATEEEKVGSFREFADGRLEYIHGLGYNSIQLMAVQEHPYYGSFGYHVSSFFAPSSRFGTPEDLKYLVNKAHSLGMLVIMDIVHSHAVKNMAEGLNHFDGTDGQYFHEGGRGYHSSWDSRLFNYGKEEVLQFLLSNVAYWIKEFHFDGFRFDGVTSMMYFHHGDFTTFDHYDKFFKDGVEWDAITYLQLANELAHDLKTGVVTIAEDMSGMPGIGRKISEGGLGFDYRLGMGLPDYWIKVLKHKSDEQWDIYEMWHVMTNRRYREKTIAYAESHDQALVGDKTLAFWLMDQEMYWNMHINHQSTVIDRGIALHKMIRLFTGVLGGEGYLNFIGNEFGHPEWVDFPREGNGWSYKYCRRQWSLVENEELRYQFLHAFDKAMISVLKGHNILPAYPAKQLHMDGENKVVVAERNNLIFVFNFHPERSIPDYQFWVPRPGAYELLLNSDDGSFGGFNRIDQNQLFHTQDEDKLSIYLTNRTAVVLKKVDAPE